MLKGDYSCRRHHFTQLCLSVDGSPQFRVLQVSKQPPVHKCQSHTSSNRQKVICSNKTNQTTLQQQFSTQTCCSYCLANANGKVWQRPPRLKTFDTRVRCLSVFQHVQGVTTGSAAPLEPTHQEWGPQWGRVILFTAVCAVLFGTSWKLPGPPRSLPFHHLVSAAAPRPMSPSDHIRNKSPCHSPCNSKHGAPDYQTSPRKLQIRGNCVTPAVKFVILPLLHRMCTWTHNMSWLNRKPLNGWFSQSDGSQNEAVYDW